MPEMGNFGLKMVEVVDSVPREMEPDAAGEVVRQLFTMNLMPLESGESEEYSSLHSQSITDKATQHQVLHLA